MAGEDDDDAVLDEVHLAADGRLADDEVARLEHLVLEIGDDVVDELLVRVGEERDGRHQRTTVVVDYLLSSKIQAQCTDYTVYRARQLYKNISMLFLFLVKDGKLSTGVIAIFNASCYG